MTTGETKMIRRVESNLKAGCSVDIGPKTLIVGPNRSGKSTIVNAIELATTGRASDIAGRATLALDAELATLMPPGADSVFARAFYGPLIPTCQVVWALEKGHKATRGAAPSPASEVVFPLREVRENLVASAEKARKWLLGLVAAEIEWPTVLSRVAPALHDRLTTLSGGTVAGLPTALETAGRQRRAAEAKATALREAPPLPVVHAPIGSAPDLAALDAAVVKAEADVSAAQAALDALPKLAPGADAVAEMGQRIVTILTGQVASKAPRCGVCGGDGPPGRFAVRLKEVEALIATGRKAIEARAAAATRVNEALARRATVQAARAAAQATAAAVANAVTETQAVAAQSREGEAVEADREAASWRELGDAVSRVMATLVGEARAAFEAKVQRYMPRGFTFGLDLVDGDREVCRFGLRSKIGGDSPFGALTALRSALSGAEWAIVTAALAAATTPDGAHAIIVPEERAFDPATLFETLLAFDSCPAQVIITSPVMPTDVPVGWTVIRCGGDVAASAALPAATVGAGVAPTAPPAVAKRGRGRPRKTPLPEAAAPSQPVTVAASNGVATELPWA